MEHRTHNLKVRVTETQWENIQSIARILGVNTSEESSEESAMQKMVHLWKITSAQARPKLWDAVDERRKKLKMQMRAHVIADEPSEATAKQA